MTIYYEMNEDFLMHFGVPGMRWGHRKQKISGSDGIRRGSAKKNKQHSSDTQGDRRKQNIKKAAKVGAAVVGTALAAYGGYKLHKFINNKSGQIQQEKGKKALDKVMEQYQHTTVSKLRNGKTQMMTRSARGTGIHEGSAKDIERARQYIDKANKGIEKLAGEAYSQHVNKKMNFGQKTANVAKYYINKKKKK